MVSYRREVYYSGCAQRYCVDWRTYLHRCHSCWSRRCGSTKSSSWTTKASLSMPPVTFLPSLSLSLSSSSRPMFLFSTTFLIPFTVVEVQGSENPILVFGNHELAFAQVHTSFDIPLFFIHLSVSLPPLIYSYLSFSLPPSLLYSCLSFTLFTKDSGLETYGTHNAAWTKDGLIRFLDGVTAPVGKTDQPTTTRG